MSVLAVGGEADCFEPVSGQAYSWDTTGGRFDANASRGALKIVNAASEVELFLASNVTEAWIHAKIYQETQGTGDYIIIKNIAGTNAFRLKFESDGDWTLSVWSSGAWSDLATSAVNAPIVAGELFTLDLHINVANSGGEITAYVNEVSVVSYTGDTLADTASFGRIEFNGFTSGTEEMFISQVIVADEDTRAWVLMTHQATGAGATTDWPSGTYADIDEAGYDADDFISTPDVDDIDTFAAANVNAAFTNYTVKAVAVAMRGNIATDSPVGDVQAAVRWGGTDYFSADLSLPKDGSDHSVQHVFGVNPATSAAWDQTAVNAAEIGVKSVV